MATKVKDTVSKPSDVVKTIRRERDDLVAYYESPKGKVERVVVGKGHYIRRPVVGEINLDGK